MKLIKVDEVFDVFYPKTLVLSSLVESEDGINFVSSSSKNNGVSTKVKLEKGIKIYPAGAITVALKGSVLSAFLQSEIFYCAHQIAVLINKEELSEVEKLIYCNYINTNKYRYNFGRQADKTFRAIEIPHPKEVRAIGSKFKLPKEPTKKSKNSSKLSLDDREWDWFIYEDLFDIERGKGIRKKDIVSGNTPFITSIDTNNGLTGLVEAKVCHGAGTITVNRNGSVGEAFYQDYSFCSTEDVHIFNPKFSMNKSIGLFLVSLIKKEKYRFNYGRKWGLARMEKSKIKLPVDSEGNPDWQFMEDYIKSLPYSANL